MGKYGRFTGGTHFKKNSIKNVKYKKSIKLKRATIEQLERLRELGLNFQIGSISEKRALELISKIAKQKSNEVRNEVGNSESKQK